MVYIYIYIYQSDLEFMKPRGCCHSSQYEVMSLGTRRDKQDSAAGICSIRQFHVRVKCKERGNSDGRGGLCNSI
jgi:hypothetical protein